MPVSVTGLRGFTADLDLADDFVYRPGIARFSHIAARPDRAILLALARPPFEKDRKTLFVLAYWPIELRRQVINPPVDQPAARVRVKRIISVQSFDLRWESRPPDSKRTDAESDPGLLAADLTLKSLNQF